MATLLGAITTGKTLKYYFDEFNNTVHFSNGKKAKIDYDGEFTYSGKTYDVNSGKAAMHRKFKKNTGFALKQVESKKMLK